MNSAKTFIARHAGIVRMASQFHLVFFRYRNHALEEVCDALPILTGLDRSSLSQRWFLSGFIILKGAVGGPTSSGRGFSSHDSQNAQVVFQGGNAGASGVANHLTEIVDFSISLRALAAHDV